MKRKRKRIIKMKSKEKIDLDILPSHNTTSLSRFLVLRIL